MKEQKRESEVGVWRRRGARLKFRGERWADTRTKTYTYSHTHIHAYTPSCLGRDFNDLFHKMCLSLIWASTAERAATHTHTDTHLCIDLTPKHEVAYMENITHCSPSERWERARRSTTLKRLWWFKCSDLLRLQQPLPHMHPHNVHSTRLTNDHDHWNIALTSQKKRRRRNWDSSQMYPLYIIVG